MSEARNSSACGTAIFAKNSSECHNLLYYFITFAFGTNMVLGVPAHSCILWLTMKEMIQGQSLEVFVFSTSLTDIFFNFSFPFVIKQYFFNCPDCKYVTIWFGLVLLVGRPLFQTFTCVERYVAVVHPVTFLKFKPYRYRISVSVAGWLVTVSSCLSIALGGFNIFHFLLVEYLALLGTKVFTCLKVLKALKHPGPGEDVKQREKSNRDKVKAFRIIQIVLASSLLTYAPVVVCLMLYFILDSDTFLVTWSVCLSSGIMTGFVQPYLYNKRILKVWLCVSS